MWCQKISICGFCDWRNVVMKRSLGTKASSVLFLCTCFVILQGFFGNLNLKEPITFHLHVLKTCPLISLYVGAPSGSEMATLRLSGKEGGCGSFCIACKWPQLKKVSGSWWHEKILSESLNMPVVISVYSSFMCKYDRSRGNRWRNHKSFIVRCVALSTKTHSSLCRWNS